MLTLTLFTIFYVMLWISTSHAYLIPHTTSTQNKISLHKSIQYPSWSSSFIVTKRRITKQQRFTSCLKSSSTTSSSSSSWDVTDNWDHLSQMNAPVILPSDDLLSEIVDSMSRENPSSRHNYDDNETSLNDAIEHINVPILLDDPPLYDVHEDDSYLEEQTINNFEDDLSKEIALLVRCNESPNQLLYQEGRAIRPLTEEERYDTTQLLSKDNKPTAFLIQTVSSLFHRHGTSTSSHERKESTLSTPLLTATGIAEWMTKGTGQKIGKNDIRISLLISKYSTYGSGALTESQFLQLYVDAISCAIHKEHEDAVLANKQRHSFTPLAKTVWREFENHGIYSPNVQQEKDLFKTFYNSNKQQEAENSIQVDECEILSWSGEMNQPPNLSMNSMKNGVSHNPSKSSHMYVELCSDKRTPKRIRDGQFVFVDEESCIGCGQCPNIAMTSFLMLDNGRARSYYQASTPEVSEAVAACPVNCIKFVSFDELKELETSRDIGDGRTDHKHLGREMTPLHVSRRSSDASHKSSWYHHLKNKCSSDKMCPQRGCYDCPMYANLGDNPFFQKKNREAERIRAKDIIDSGQGDLWRKSADL